MNMWIIVAVAIGMLAIAGIFVVSAVTNNDTPTSNTESTGCGSCNGQCTAESGCGQATCGASNGGKCTCGK